MWILQCGDYVQLVRCSNTKFTHVKCESSFQRDFFLPKVNNRESIAAIDANRKVSTDLFDGLWKVKYFNIPIILWRLDLISLFQTIYVIPLKLPKVYMSTQTTICVFSLSEMLQNWFNLPSYFLGLIKYIFHSMYSCVVDEFIPGHYQFLITFLPWWQLFLQVDFYLTPNLGGWMFFHAAW